MHNFGFWWGFLVTISLYVVLEAGRAQFGILAGVSIAFPILCSLRRRPWTLWDFVGGF